MKQDEIVALAKDGLSQADIARRLDCNPGTVYRALRNYDLIDHDECLRLSTSSRLLLVADNRILYSLSAPAGYTFLDLLLAAVYMSTHGQRGQPAPWWYDEEDEEEIHTAA